MTTMGLDWASSGDSTRLLMPSRLATARAVAALSGR